MSILLSYGVLVLVLIGSSAALVRIVLTLSGMLKGPLLATFQRYGGEDPYYYPLPALFMWLALLLLSSVTVVAGLQRPFLVTDILALLLAYLAYLTHQHERQVVRLLRRFPKLPLWYDTLMRITERPERRRIAYMWLRLPQRTRLIYNANNRAFFIWAELVILGTVSDA